MVNHDKEYVATFRLGVKTNTLAIWGEVIKEEKTSFSKEDILKILPRFTGEIQQIPPMYSAVNVDGKRLYDLARDGKEVERKARPVTVYELSLTDFDEESQQGTLKIKCSKGTYVRTLIDDIGDTLGSFGVMTSLVRTNACGYSIDDAISLEKARELTDFKDYIKDTESLFMTYGYVKVTSPQAKRFQNGGALDKNRTYLAKLNPPDGTILRVKDDQNKFLGLGIIKGEELKIYKLFAVN